MPAQARKPDPQTDYEDPVDRLYRRSRGKRDRGDPPDKTPSTTAAVSFTFGAIALVPCLGLLFGPLAVLLGLIGLSHTRDPNVSGKGKAKTGIWFGLIAMVFNYLVPLGLYIYMGARGGWR
jgi:hypothetical protein